jgi:hypothetical protein
MLSQDILEIEKCKGLLTCVTFSEQPFFRLDIDNLDYINHCSTFYSKSDFFIATLKTLEQVKTDYVVFCDSDDPFPQELILPTKGLVYGDFIYNENNKEYTLISKHWSEKYHLDNHWLIHKPILNTKSALDIITRIPFSNVHFHFAFYYFVAKYHGSTYDNRLKLKWIKAKTGQHKKASELFHKTINWIREIDRSYLSY